MPPLRAELQAQNMRETNSRLLFWLESLAAAPVEPSPGVRAATPQQICGILSELMRAGGWLRELPAEKHAVLERELSEYRKNVERLRDLLPTIHSALLEERARLERERSRVKAAAEWARSSQQTL